jgi:hypothetical protein
MIVASNFWFWDKPSWGWAEVWALLAIVLVFVALSALLQPPANSEKRFALALINGMDNRWSTSKASVALWTFGLIFAFLTILIHTRGDGLDNLTLSSQYLALLGIPAGAALSAKAITQNKVDKGELKKTEQTRPPDPLKGTAQLFSDDSGNVDLADAQYFAFSLLLLAYFFAQFLSSESTTLPNLPDTLVGLSGVSAASYIVKKGVKNTA